MGSDPTDQDEMIATVTKVMAEMVETLRDEASTLSGDAAADWCIVTPSGRGPLRSVRWPRFGRSKPPAQRRSDGAMGSSPPSITRTERVVLRLTGQDDDVSQRRVPTPSRHFTEVSSPTPVACRVSTTPTRRC